MVVWALNSVRIFCGNVVLSTVFEGHLVTYIGNRNIAAMMSPASNWPFSDRCNHTVIIIFYYNQFQDFVLTNDANKQFLIGNTA